MNILHVIDSGGFYGAEVVLLNLIEAQRTMGLNPSLLSLGNESAGEKNIEYESRKKGVPLVTLRFRDGLNLCGAFDIVNTAKSLGTHIIHTHGYKADILLGIVPRRIRSIPVVATLHGWTATKLLSKMKVYEIMDALAVKSLDGVVGVSESLSLRTMIRRLGIHPIIINNGVARLEFQKEAFKSKYPTIAANCSDKFKFLAIGRLSREKGFDILVRAVASLIAENYAASLVIMGEGGERKNLEKIIAEKNLVDKVYLVGYQQGAHNYMADFDAFVLSSLTEGLPITILEAMQAGLPIVATRVGEIPLLLNNGELGELVIPNNLEDMISALRRVYAYRQMAAVRATKAKKKALSDYGVERMASQYYELYKKFIVPKT